MKKSFVSALLILLQAASFLYIVFFGPLFATNKLLLFLQFISILIIMDAFWEMRRTSFYRVPDVGKQKELVTSGIYKFIRNPMYLAELLFAWVLVVVQYSIPRLFASLVLLIVLVLKIYYEENLLKKNFKSFAAYKKRSWRLIPFIF